MTTRDTTQEAGRLGWLTRQLFSVSITFGSSIVSAVYGRGQSLRSKINTLRPDLTTSLRVLADTASLAKAEQAEGEGETSGLTILGLSGIALVLVILGVIVVCILPVCIILLLTLLGPAIGNVFSGVTESI